VLKRNYFRRTPIKALGAKVERLRALFTIYEHVYSPYRQKHTKYTKDSTQIHKNQVHKKDKQKNNQSVSSLTAAHMNTFIRQKTDRKVKTVTQLQ